ncbi:hypothetical protein Y032_0006g3166 [Ancylostoma ceylanicum]|uniref:Uncharacterized protein n=1 Tax=Ancylostoma ceylanicum TaxID=53326 RepID=A0A016VQ97_9BILA|nr:hypothetical protein Y032_0006g3166 [Ancylostoma ceylanicum]
MYGSECLPLSRAHERVLNTVEMRMLRWACGSTRRDKVPNEDIRTIMQTAHIQLKLRAQRLRWYGHVMRRPSLYPTRQAMEMDVAGKRPRGAPKKRWKDAVRKDMGEVGVTKDDKQDRVSGVGEPTQRTLQLCGTNAKEKKKKLAVNHLTLLYFSSAHFGHIRSGEYTETDERMRNKQSASAFTIVRISKGERNPIFLRFLQSYRERRSKCAFLRIVKARHATVLLAPESSP